MGTKMTKLNELKALMADALDPFSRVAAIMEPLNLPDEKPLRDCAPGVWPTLGDCRNARTALAILPALIAAVEALKPFAEYVKGPINPTPEGMNIAFGMLPKTDRTGWETTTTGLCMRDLINAHAAHAKSLKGKR